MKLPKRESSGGGLGSDKFLKLKDGESVNGIFRGEIHEFYIKWDGGKSSVVGPNEAGAKVRFKLNFVTFKESKFQVLVWEFGQPVYNQLSDINSEYDLSKIKVKISRRGTGLDTEYAILPLLADKDKLNPATMSQIELLSLNILDTKSQSKTPDTGWGGSDDFGPPPESDDEIPIPF